jgi:hypothetical protein
MRGWWVIRAGQELSTWPSYFFTLKERNLFPNGFAFEIKEKD